MMKAAKQPDEMDTQADTVVEIQPTHRVNVPQTNTLYRLIPAASDTARSRQSSSIGRTSTSVMSSGPTPRSRW
jgi:hypothetical protein